MFFYMEKFYMLDRLVQDLEPNFPAILNIV